MLHTSLSSSAALAKLGERLTPAQWDQFKSYALQEQQYDSIRQEALARLSTAVDALPHISTINGGTKNSATADLSAICASEDDFLATMGAIAEVQQLLYDLQLVELVTRPPAVGIAKLVMGWDKRRFAKRGPQNGKGSSAAGAATASGPGKKKGSRMGGGIGGKGGAHNTSQHHHQQQNRTLNNPSSAQKRRRLEATTSISPTFNTAAGLLHTESSSTTTSLPSTAQKPTRHTSGGGGNYGRGGYAQGGKLQSPQSTMSSSSSPRPPAPHQSPRATTVVAENRGVVKMRGMKRKRVKPATRRSTRTPGGSATINANSGIKLGRSRSPPSDDEDEDACEEGDNDEDEEEAGEEDGNRAEQASDHRHRNTSCPLSPTPSSKSASNRHTPRMGSGSAAPKVDAAASTVVKRTRELPKARRNHNPYHHASSTSSPVRATKRLGKRLKKAEGGRRRGSIITAGTGASTTAPQAANTSVRGWRKPALGMESSSSSDDDGGDGDEDEGDEDEPTYCVCERVSFGDMICCDNDTCPIEWFHFSCVKIRSKPGKGKKWFCPQCRGDKPTVQKAKLKP